MNCAMALLLVGFGLAHDPNPSSSKATAMTDCNRDPLHFSRLGPKAVVADFQGGRLTTDAGALLLREVADRLGLFDALDAAIPDPRHPAFIVHDQQAMLAQRVTAIALGYEDLNDHQTLRADPALQLAAGKAARAGRCPSPRPRPSAAWRTASTARPWSGSPRSWSISSSPPIPTPPEHLILDFDATDDRVHGQQEGRFFHGYYDHHCFLPLYVFCGDELLAAYLRPSDIDAAKHARAVLKLLVRKLRAAWPEVKITIRGDSGFCRWRLMRWCDSHGIGYVLGLAKNPVAAARRPGTRSSGPSGSSAGPASRSGSSARSRTRRGAGTGARRVIVKAEHNAQGANPRFVVANVPGDPQELYEDVYCQRGEMENRIKEQQLDLFADRTSCHRFLANQFRLLLSSAAYVLVQALRRTALAGTELAQAQVGTIRLKLFKVAARVVVTARRVVFHLASSYPYQEVFRAVSRRVIGWPPVASLEGG